MHIADLGLGSNAARITAVRSLPNVDRKENPTLESDSADENGVRNELNHILSEEEDLGGLHVNLKVSFAYQGLPSGKSVHSKAKNVQ